MKTLLTKRTVYLIEFFLVAGLLAFAAFLEYYKGILPCPLCMMQRFCLAILGILFVIGASFNLKRIGSFFIGSLAFLFSLAGAVLAGRQAWIQHNPSGLSSNCDVSFQYMMKVLPFDEVLKKAFAGGAECSQIDWQLWHLSLAEWSFLLFIFFICISIWQIARK